MGVGWRRRAVARTVAERTAVKEALLAGVVWLLHPVGVAWLSCLLAVLNVFAIATEP